MEREAQHAEEPHDEMPAEDQRRQTDASTSSRDRSESPEAALSVRFRKRADELADWHDRLLRADELQELILLLRSFGLDDHDLAKVVPRVTVRSIRRWRAIGAPETHAAERWESLDDLRAIIGYFLVDGSMDRRGIVAWLRSRQASLDQERPLDVLGERRFADVRDAAETVLGAGEATSATARGGSGDAPGSKRSRFSPGISQR